MSDAWHDIRDADGKLLAKIDRRRLLLQFKRGKRITIVDLREHLEASENETLDISKKPCYD